MAFRIEMRPAEPGKLPSRHPQFVRLLRGPGVCGQQSASQAQ